MGKKGRGKFLIHIERKALHDKTMNFIMGEVKNEENTYLGIYLARAR